MIDSMGFDIHTSTVQSYNNRTTLRPVLVSSRMLLFISAPPLYNRATLIGRAINVHVYIFLCVVVELVASCSGPN